MKVFFIRLPIKIFYFIIFALSIFINLVVYLYGRDVVVKVSTGYQIQFWERIILVLQEFFSVGI
ncbi:hypothetical protein SAMN02745227_00360 [Anaerobranca californiensis DSM 14826]|jgi:hypothetical protein|uniref:Uncharacterized protein n=1 Tax=Anaerobranca californiensis DSM 14826 TaxID=1120989 RepID=A0A1M6L3V0_9FIRM|nr:hypothetical protein [Anaerobranca californiensis]SHJ65870.1 hypothetical protein SAMN02745227_00360 [Anaerobranca californiensis DSM 14826]